MTQLAVVCMFSLLIFMKDINMISKHQGCQITIPTEIFATRLDESWFHHFQLGLVKVFSNFRFLQWWDSPKCSNLRFLQWWDSTKFSNFRFLQWWVLSKFFQILDFYNGGTQQNFQKCFLDSST